MNNSIEKDDEKFRNLISKQRSTSESFVDSLRSDEDVIENDDNTMDDLLFYQSLSEDEPKHASIEEKYEEEIMIQEVTKIIEKNLVNCDDDPFAVFFNDEEDEIV